MPTDTELVEALAHFEAGNRFFREGHMPEAAASYRQALRLNPHHGPSHNNLGNALQASGHIEEAMGCFREALRCNPESALAHYNLANAHSELGGLDEAVSNYRQALSINPHLVEAHINLGNALMHVGARAEGVAHYEQALLLRPGDTNAHWQRSWARLLEGDFAGGWQDFEHRLDAPTYAAREFDEPRWDGSALAGKTILVYAEQGLGDTIQFARYLSMVKERGGRVVFECQQEIAALCASASGIDQLIVQGAPLPPFDVQVPLLSLAKIFGTTVSNVPAPRSYLSADAGRVEYWSTQAQAWSGFEVGIVWRGNPKNILDRYRSLPLACFERLARVPGVRLVSLQVGAGSAELAQVPFPIVDWGGRFDPHSLDDLAGALRSLDLIITIESAVAHLAGALGVPVWTLLTVTPAWRWLLERADSPWYPTMRLFRQESFGAWDQVLENVAHQLARR